MKRLHALENGAGLVSHNPVFRGILVNLVTPATRAADGCDGFHPMAGYTIAQTVAMKIEGAHAVKNKSRMSVQHWRAVY